MLPSKAPPAGAAAPVLAGNKAAFGGRASVLPAKQAPGAADGKRTAAGLRSVLASAGRDDFSDQDLKPKAFSAEKIKKMAEETSSLLREVCVPKDSTFPEQVYFSKELEGLQKVCDGMVDHVGGAGLDEDVAISTLIGVQARVQLLLASRGCQQKVREWKEPLEDLLMSSMYQTKTSVSNYMATQNPKPKANSANSEAAAAVRDGDAKKAADGEDDDAKAAAEGEDDDAEKAAEEDDGGAELAAEGEDGDAKPKASLADIFNKGRISFVDLINITSVIPPASTVCSHEEVKAALEKTLSLLEGIEPTHSTSGKAGLFCGIRTNCRALKEDVDKHGVSDKVVSGIMLIHLSVIGILGLHKKHFCYDDTPDDDLLRSLRRLEVALQDYKMEE